MKQPLLLAALSLSFCLTVCCADTICQWNFNSEQPDGSTSTGRMTPSLGAGTAVLLGGVTNAFVTGASIDPASVDNSACSLTKFPQVMVSNRTAGVRFETSTHGFQGISIGWVQQNSTTASRYLRVQYSTDRTNFQDLPALAILKESTWTNVMISLAAGSGADNNPNFAFQIVTEFESTAAGGLPGYMPTAANSSYLPSGTIKLDAVTISGSPLLDGNTPPYVSAAIQPQTIEPNQSTAALPFSILDAEDPASILQLSASTSPSSVIPVSNVTFAGAGANRTVTVRSGAAPGTANVTVWVTDSGAKSNSFSFAVTVLPADRPPMISPIAPVYTLVGCQTPAILYNVEDPESPAFDLNVDAVAWDGTLLPNSGFVYGGSGTNRTLTLKPLPGRVGVTPVMLTVSDGSNLTSCAFPLVVLPSANSLLYDSFNYADGGVCSNSASLWQHRSGTANDLVLSDGRLHLSGDRTEDVSLPLHGGPYETGTGAVLFVSFNLQVPSLPRALPEYFAHLMSGGSLVSRIYIGTSNAMEGCYRLAVSNGSTNAPAIFPMSMNKNVLYTVVVRYDVDSAVTRLWVNPQTEASPSVSASDPITPGRITAFGFRQSSGISTDLQIDQLNIGTTFEAVTSSALAPVLRYSTHGSGIVLSWDDPQFRLQVAANPAGTFTNVPGATSPWQLIASGNAFYRLLKATTP